MRSTIIAAAALAAAASPALASIAFTAPIESSNLKAGNPFTLRWIDDGKTPTLAAFGVATFSLCVGGTVQQACLQTLGTANVGSSKSLSVTIDPTSGPNAAGTYFIRADSTVPDPTNTFGANYLAFSAKFDLTSATGTFNATVAPIASAGSVAANVTSPTTGAGASAAASGTNVAGLSVNPITAAASATSAGSSARQIITSTLSGNSSLLAQNGSAAGLVRPVAAAAFGVSVAALFLASA